MISFCFQGVRGAGKGRAPQHYALPMAFRPGVLNSLRPMDFCPVDLRLLYVCLVDLWGKSFQRVSLLMEVLPYNR